MSRRQRKRQRRGRKGRRIRLLTVAVVLGAGAWVLWPFWQLSGQFGAQPLKQPSRLYGRPTVLHPGDPSTAERLAAELAGLRYRKLASGASLAPGTYRVDGSSVEVFLRRFATPAGLAGGGRLRVTTRAGAVTALAFDGRRVDSARLEPPLVTSYYGPDLRERRPAGIDAIPEDLILAVLAAEDATFLEHPGVSLSGVLRAAWVNLREQGVRQGGSTLTQQLVKNLYLSHERTLARKLREVILAVLLELRYDKRDILQAYLNEIYWGRSGRVNLMGVGAAAWAYFGKEPSQLTLAESALLAGMIQSPATYSPRAHPERALERRAYVLGRLAQLGWIDEAEAERASGEPLGILEEPLTSRWAAYFADAALAEARERFGVVDLRDSGHVVLSTLVPDDQLAAEEAIAWGVEALEEGWEKGARRASPLQAALLSIDPRDGSVLAYVGGRDYGESQFDRLAHAERQAGSAFKPVVYAAAFEDRVAHPATFLEDAPLTVTLANDPWTPQNADGEYHGWVSVRSALERSLNVPTARLAMEVGLERIAALAVSMGIRERPAPFPALALGALDLTPIELATVYATLASGGRRPTPHRVLAVFERNGERVAGRPRPEAEPVLSRGVAYLVTRVLQGVFERGTATAARGWGFSDPLAGKTGTTNDRRDSWFVGYSPDRVVLVWVGYDDNSRTRLSGTRAALPIWARFSHRVRPRGGYPGFDRPPAVVSAWIDPETGGLATSRCPTIAEEVFLEGFAPEVLCPHHDGWRARPLEQPDQLEVDGRHPFKRWLRMIREEKKRRRAS